MCKNGQRLTHRVKHIWVRVRLHLIQNASCANEKEVTTAIVQESVVEHLAFESAGCIICAPAPCGRMHTRGPPIRFDEHRDGLITFEAVIDSWLPRAIIND